MSRVFFDLKIWQKAEILAVNVYKITRVFPKDELFSLTSQLRRAAVSVAANIAESHGRSTVKDKFRCLYISRAEIFEVRSHLRIALKLGYLSQKNYNILEKSYGGLTFGINSYIKKTPPIS